MIKYPDRSCKTIGGIAIRLLWDFDGTLFDTYPAYAAIFADILGPSADKREILGHLKRTFTHAARHYNLSERQLHELFRKEEQLHPADTPPFEGVEDVLRRAESNVIMTHKPRAEAERILDYYGFGRYFADMIAGDDGYPRKPDPASYRALHDKHGIDLAIGDRELDILPAKALGIRTCLFQNVTPGAHYYIDGYEQFHRIEADFTARRGFWRK